MVRLVGLVSFRSAEILDETGWPMNETVCRLKDLARGTVAGRDRMIRVSHSPGMENGQKRTITA